MELLKDITFILFGIVISIVAVIFIVPFPFFVIGWGLLFIPEAAGWITVDGYFMNAGAGFGVVISIAFLRMIIFR